LFKELLSFNKNKKNAEKAALLSCDA